MQNNQAIFETLFSRNFSDEENTEFLKAIAAEHPYFSPAQFFLLQKTKADDALFEKRASQTNVLFNNPHWLNFQLKQTESTIEHEPVIAPPVVESAAPVFEPGFVSSGNGISKETAEVVPTVQAEKITETEPVPETIEGSPDDTDAPEETENAPEPMKIELKMPVDNTAVNEAMLFEPMHVVDYFASQGIKLTDDVQTADKLGKQLKSFTEWLKTMKKVHVENEAETTVQTDENVQAMAENSNTSAEVLTESMAEVFARQGKTEKASEVYQKLSLLNPAKSTYFAAKIENLKGI